MDQKCEVIHLEASQERMLFVRITDIITEMVRAPVVAACVFLLALSSFAQYAFSSPKTLDFTIYADGTTHVSYQTDVDSQSPDFILNLYGTNAENLVVQDENNTLLSSKVNSNTATIATLGASTIKVDYDTPDLVSKNGKTWTFHVNSPIDYSVLLPTNSVIIGISTSPLNLQVVDGQSLISLPSGTADISYVFGTVSTSQTATIAIQKAQDFINTINSAGIKTPQALAKLDDARTSFNQGKYSDAEVLAGTAKSLALQEQETYISSPKSAPDNNTLPILIGAGAAAAVGATVMIVKRTRSNKIIPTPEIPKDGYIPPDKETIYKFRPELRQDDKDIVAFISEKGGRAYESELRKKFLLPRTTMWRAVKRLEREGVIEIEKIDQQNLIKLRKIEEGDQQ
ncbi:MAG: MarR family transcriptional regulator [Nitrososphaera sp.]|jgi:uncharacterized membrane protein